MQEDIKATENAAQEGDLVISAEQMQQWADQIQQLKDERDEYLSLAQRAQADLDNYRRRNASLRADALADGRAEVAEAMLPVIDNLGRALAAAEGSPLKEGVEMTLRQMLAALEKLGVTEIPAEDQPFDPNVHHAVVRTTGDVPGQITQVLMKGYAMGERVLRCAMVGVCGEA